jgi:histidine triad (HIT) family protein
MACIFCDIVKHKHEQSKFIIHQDNDCTVFMDHIQQNPGHVLIVPNKHIRNIYSLKEDLAGELFKLVTRYAKKVKKVFKVDGIDIYQCNGKAADQSVFHLHLHIFPRKKKDGLFCIYGNKEPNWEDFDQILKYKKKLMK